MPATPLQLTQRFLRAAADQQLPVIVFYLDGEKPALLTNRPEVMPALVPLVCSMTATDDVAQVLHVVGAASVGDVRLCSVCGSREAWDSLSDADKDIHRGQAEYAINAMQQHALVKLCRRPGAPDAAPAQAPV
jgi:hypothetical protein